VDQALQASQNDRVPSRKVALGATIGDT